MKISRVYPEYAVLDTQRPEIAVEEQRTYCWGEPVVTDYRLTYTVEFVVTAAELKELLGD